MSTGNTQQAGAGQHQQYSDRQEQISASNRTTGRSRSAPAIQQPPGTGLLRRPPSVRRKKNRLSLTLPIQQHTGIYQYTTPYHSVEQRRARKGGARGGKAGFVTPSAFPPRKPAHAKVSPRKEKPQLTAVHNSRKKVPANKDATTSLSYREELHRPEAPQGRTRPLSVTGSPISCDSTLPFQGFSSVASI